MYGAQMGVASGWVGLSLRQVVDFGGRVRGVVNGLCHGLTDKVKPMRTSSSRSQAKTNIL